MNNEEARRTVERVARESYGRLIAILAVRTRDVACAEDLLAEAFAAALEQWPSQGVPINPDGWLVTVAKRRHVDLLRRGQVRVNGGPHLQMLAAEIEEASHLSGELPDRRLALMFACAHPLIEPKARAPLILQAVLGIPAKAIASAFLVSQGSMNQRLVRAKAHIKESGIPFCVPDRDEMPNRLDAVLEALYAAYSTGWDEARRIGARAGGSLAQPPDRNAAARGAGSQGIAGNDAVYASAARRSSRRQRVLCPH
jgi:RNA polymerase sigma-70 factor (ECF subfamily)